VQLLPVHLESSIVPYIHTILHPTDLSETSAAAFRLACSLARDYNSDLLILHVYPQPINGAEEIDRDRDDDIESVLLDDLHALAPRDTNLHIDYRVEEGSPAEVILDVARHCDLIVMGTHGRGGISRAIMGSVAEQVLRDATCPVVTVRPTVKLPEEVTVGADAELHEAH
jgi:nucleotide-binding universal stress UspA family protein